MSKSQSRCAGLSDDFYFCLFSSGVRGRSSADIIAYFLITWDIIRYAQSRGFFYVGRGSGANSIVAYCLQITDVDPMELDLYFERFLNPHRKIPPDFDIDFSWKDRDEVIDDVLNGMER